MPTEFMNRFQIRTKTNFPKTQNCPREKGQFVSCTRNIKENLKNTLLKMVEILPEERLACLSDSKI